MVPMPSLQSGKQPSAGAWLPSSQASPGSRVPSPHSGSSGSGGSGPGVSGPGSSGASMVLPSPSGSPEVVPDEPPEVAWSTSPLAVEPAERSVVSPGSGVGAPASVVPPFGASDGDSSRVWEVAAPEAAGSSSGSGSRVQAAHSASHKPLITRVMARTRTAACSDIAFRSVPPRRRCTSAAGGPAAADHAGPVVVVTFARRGPPALAYRDTRNLSGADARALRLHKGGQSCPSTM